MSAPNIIDLNQNNFPNSQIIITNILGKTIYKSEILPIAIGTKSEIDLGGNPDGIYFYQISNETEIIYSGKLILVK